ncbi:hypothetical protein [Nonomuraea fuscirosea]|uniref:hypothetical protein n=1 Tax=Nonomuraea fuscirosea TaxID=1291556 RepID=UPI0033F342E5
MSSFDGQYDGLALLVAGDGRLTEVHATIQLAGGEHPLAGAEVTWDATVEVEGLVPASVVLDTTALRVEGGKEDLPVTVGGAALRCDLLRVSLRGGRHVWATS